MPSTLLALVLLAAAAGLLWYLGGLLFGAVRLPFGGMMERRRFEAYVARAKRGDRLLQAGALAGALAEFETALYPQPARSPSMAEAVARHHTALLSRLIVAADRVQDERVRLIGLAKAERLLQERRILQRRYLTLRQSGSRQRLRELEGEFGRNTAELRGTLTVLVAEIAARRREPVLH